MRIVTLLPSLTESVCELGACARLVGTDRYSNWPASVALLAKVGGLEDGSLEQIVSLHPDLVLAANSSRVIERLDELGIPVVALRTDTMADAHHVLLTVAQLLGLPAAGEQTWLRLDARIAAAATRVPAELRHRRVYFEVSEAPHAASAGSFIGELLTRLDLDNAVPATLGPFPKLNPEYIVHAQPDVIMAGQRELAEMAGRPGWSALTALRTGQSCGFPAERFEILIRPGPRLAEAADLIVECPARLGAGGRR